MIELLIALVVGVSMISAAGLATANLVRQREFARDNSAATSLGQRKVEEVRAQIKSMLLPGATLVDFAGSEDVDEGGSSNLATYTVAWTVDFDPADLHPVEVGGLARLTITVSHTRGAREIVRLVTYERTVI